MVVVVVSSILEDISQAQLLSNARNTFWSGS